MDKAEELFKQAIAIRLKVQGADHIDIAANYNNLAQVYQKQVCARTRGGAAPSQRGVVEL